MNIQFTDEQLKALAKMVYLGNWMINSTLLMKERLETYDELAQYVYSNLDKLKLPDLIKFDKKYNKYYPVKVFDDEMQLGVIKDYDNETFWNELSDRMGYKEFLKKYGEDKIVKMTEEERFLKFQKIIIKFEKEFEDNGIENLEIKKK